MPAELPCRIQRQALLAHGHRAILRSHANPKPLNLAATSSSGSLSAGALSGLATACLSTPIDYIKIQAQLGHVLSPWRRLGIRILYRGHTMNMLREGVFTAIYLGLYDRLRVRIIQETGAPTNPSLLLVALTAAGTGALAWVGAYPFDTLKSRAQALGPGRRPLTIRDALAQAEARGGLKGLYRGCGGSTIRAVLVTGSRLWAYEAGRAAWSQTGMARF